MFAGTPATGLLPISCAQMYNPDYLEGDKQIDCRYYDDAAELAAAVEEYRQKYEGDDSMAVYAQGSWLVITDAGSSSDYGSV